MADPAPYGNPSTAEPGVAPAGANTQPPPLNPSAPRDVRANLPMDEGKMVRPLPVGWPRGNRAYPIQHSGQIIEPLEITPEEDAAVQQLYEQLKPEATTEARDYVLSRTPAAYQEAMVAKIEADWPLPPVEDPLAREGQARERRDLNPNYDPNVPPYQPSSGTDPRMPQYPQR
jgi:hypothetical protein